MVIGMMVLTLSSSGVMAWPWDRVDISKLQTHIKVEYYPNGPYENHVGLSLTVTNHTDSFIGEVHADCSVLTSEGNRVYKGEVTFHGPAVKPGGQGSLKASIQIGYQFREAPPLIQCEISSAKGSK